MGSFCPYLWQEVYINRSGMVFACCHLRPKPIGNIYNAPLKEIVNSRVARRLRESSLSGSLSCYPTCNLLDKSRSTPGRSAESQIDYSSLRTLHISFAEACNIRCVMCDNPQRHAANPIVLDPTVVIYNVDLAPFVTIIVQGGEPLFIPECLEFMNHLEKIGKKYTLFTNGLLIDDRCALRLASYARKVTVSLNGATKRTHESINLGSRFERVIENVRRMRRAREELGSGLILVGHMTITPSNLREIPEFLRTFPDLGFDRINFGFVKETVPAFLRNNPEFESQLAADISAAMVDVVGQDVDSLRLRLLGLWNPANRRS